MFQREAFFSCNPKYRRYRDNEVKKGTRLAGTSTQLWPKFHRLNTINRVAKFAARFPVNDLQNTKNVAIETVLIRAVRERTPIKESPVKVSQIDVR